MVTRRQLRDYAAENPVQVDLAEQLVGQEASMAVQDGYGAFVAGRLDG
jgi:hypothetical protein